MSSRRIVAYDPETGDYLGELPDYTMLRTVRHLDGLPTMEVRYPASGTNRTFLNNALEVAVQRVDGDGEGEEFWNSRYLLATTPDNDELADGVDRAYHFVGIRAKLDMALVMTPSNSPKPDGSPYQPLRIWTNKTVGAILGDGFTENQDLGFLAGLTKDFTFEHDSTGAAWTVDETIPYLEVPVEMPYGQLVQMFVNWGIIDVVFNGREFRCFPARTHMYRDLTLPPAPVGFYWGAGGGITKSTQATSYLGTTTDALVIGTDGKMFTPHNNLSDGHAYYGPTMRSTSVPWARNADQARVGAEELFRGGRNKRDEFTIEANWDASNVEPDRDFRLGDRVFVQIGDNPSDWTGDDNVGEQRVLTIEETDTDSRTGSVTFADRLLRLETLAAQRLMRLSAGSEVSSTGQARSPGVDEREPTAPTNLVITMGNDADESGRQRGNILIEWDHDENAVADPVTGQVDPIGLKRFEIEIESDETDDEFQFIRGVPGDKRSARLKGTLAGLAADTTYRVRVRAISYTGVTPSAWLTSTTQTVPDDLDALPGADEIWDARHRNAAVRVKRAADAGTGFSFVTDTSEQVAQFTSVTPVLDYGVGPKPKSFRKQCKPGDVIVVDGEHKRVSGTAANTRIAVRFFDVTGATISTVNAISSELATTSWSSLTAGTATAPAGAASFSVRVNANVITGFGANLRVRNVSADRRTVESRLHDDVGTERTLAALAITSKHTLSAATINGGTINGTEINGVVINGAEINAGEFHTTGGLDLVGGTFTFGSITMAISGGFLELTGGGIGAPSATFGGTTTVNDVTMIGDLTAFTGSIELVNGDVTCVALHETSARKGKADLKPLADARRLLDVPTYTYRKARDTKSPRQIGVMADDLAAAGFDELIRRDDDGDPADVTYSRLVAVLLDIVREQDARIERLENGRD